MLNKRCSHDGVPLEAVAWFAGQHKGGELCTQHVKNEMVNEKHQKSLRSVRRWKKSTSHSAVKRDSLRVVKVEIVVLLAGAEITTGLCLRKAAVRAAAGL